MNIPNLHNSAPLDESDFVGMEEWIYKQPYNLEKEIAMRLLSECRTLKHQLNDPNYSYSGRIHRAALLCRDATIDDLRKENKCLIAEQEAKHETSR